MMGKHNLKSSTVNLIIRPSNEDHVRVIASKRKSDGKARSCSFSPTGSASPQRSIYTAITTTMVEDDNTSGRGSSQRRYLSQRGSPYEVRMEMEINLAAGQSHQMRQCFQELRNFDQQCRCEAIREVVRRQQQGQGQGQGQEGQCKARRCNKWCTWHRACSRDATFSSLNNARSLPSGSKY